MTMQQRLRASNSSRALPLPPSNSPRQQFRFPPSIQLPRAWKVFPAKCLAARPSPLRPRTISVHGPFRKKACSRPVGEAPNKLPFRGKIRGCWGRCPRRGLSRPSLYGLRGAGAIQLLGKSCLAQRSGRAPSFELISKSSADCPADPDHPLFESSMDPAVTPP